MILNVCIIKAYLKNIFSLFFMVGFCMHGHIIILDIFVRSSITKKGWTSTA